MKQEKNKIQNNKNFKSGFTLLELLVVVFIIGILAAIALPKYQLAVDKTEFAKFQSMVASLRDAYDEYVLIHGKGTKNFEDLSFSMPESFTKVYDSDLGQCISDNNMWCCMREYKVYSENSYWGGSIYCGKQDADLSFAYLELLFSMDGTPANRVGKCLARQTNSRANRLCNAIGSDKINISLITPSGTIYYRRYTLN